ncbi:MAG: aminodeoxychorismate/anthranilate synthase component II [Oscillospiraceae bacterium]|jgi:anthranilate synthase component 2|nr:aminodeoxychorismate/anthranilate synthase component II [Oscillospiraceae bacterium]
MTLIIDNYDSFTYNLYQLVGELDSTVQVYRNDAIRIPEIIGLHPSHIILSPGPGKPSQSGVCKDVIHVFGPATPILGVCLGHQAICEEYGATVSYAKQLMHGKPSRITVTDAQDNPRNLFAGLGGAFQGARYHSLAAAADTLPDCLEVTAIADDGEVMAVRHREYPVFGVQFHPESILTPNGRSILKNFLEV